MTDEYFEGETQPSVTPDTTGTVIAGDKPSWRPKAAGYVALIWGPLAGALLAAASLRRMGEARKAQQTVFYTLLLCVAFLIPFLLAIPASAPIKKIIIVAVEGAGFSVFPSILRENYVKWKTAHPGGKPRNDWTATGWGILGGLMYLALAVLILSFRL